MLRLRVTVVRKCRPWDQGGVAAPCSGEGGRVEASSRVVRGLDFAGFVLPRGGNHGVLETGTDDSVDKGGGQNRRRGLEYREGEPEVDHGRNEEDNLSLEGAHSEEFCGLDPERFLCRASELIYRFSLESRGGGGCAGVPRQQQKYCHWMEVFPSGNSDSHPLTFGCI